MKAGTLLVATIVEAMVEAIRAPTQCRPVSVREVSL